MKTHYFVTADTKLPNGGALKRFGCSRVIERLSVLRRVLKRVRRSIPEAYAVRETILR